MVELFRSGDYVVSTITEREGPQRKPSELFPGLDMAVASKILETFPYSSYAPATGRLMHTYQSFLLRTPNRTILIDTCVGENKARPPHFQYPKQDFLLGFKAEGVALEDIDIVINTHLHVDHCGWNTVLKDGKWEPTFPNATYYIGQIEYDYWEKQARQGVDLPARIWTDSVLPLVDSGKALIVPEDYRLSDDIWFSHAPGHTPGQFMVNVQAGDTRLIFATDAIHHPLQVYMPQHATIFCEDKPLAVETRMKLLNEAADTDAVIFPEHFAYPVAGRVKREGNGFRYEYVDAKLRG